MSPSTSTYDPAHTRLGLLQPFLLLGFLNRREFSRHAVLWKPDSRILHHALNATGAGPDEALYVGDSGEDLEAALLAGVQPVLVARKDGYADPLRNPGRKPEVEYAGRDPPEPCPGHQRPGGIAGLALTFEHRNQDWHPRQPASVSSKMTRGLFLSFRRFFLRYLESLDDPLP